MLLFRHTRRPWIAGLLQFLTPGLGNVYCGNPCRGVAVFLFYWAMTVSSLVSAMLLPRIWNLLLPVLVILTTLTLVVVDGIRGAKSAEPDFQLRRYNRWYIYLLLYIGVAVLQPFVFVIPLRANLLQTARLPTPGMAPTLLPGDYFLTNMMTYRFSNPARGDVVVFSPADRPGASWVQRVVGLPGETIEIRQKSVYVNGQKLDEPYVQFTRRSGSEDFPGDSMDSTILEDDAYFLLGDNRDNSADSRFSGPVRRNQVHGKARTIYFSWDPEQQTMRWERLGYVPE